VKAAATATLFAATFPAAYARYSLAAAMAPTVAKTRKNNPVTSNHSVCSTRVSEFNVDSAATKPALTNRLLPTARPLTRPRARIMGAEDLEAAEDDVAPARVVLSSPTPRF
jgi:hypothetical protein